MIRNYRYEIENKIYESSILPIMVYDKPYFLIDDNPIKRNLDFLNNFRPDYLDKTTKILLSQIKNIENDDIIEKNNLSTQIRLIYGQSLETFFAFIFALLQAPLSIVGWLQKYSITKLKKLVKIINEKQHFEYFKILLPEISWFGLSKTLNMFEYSDDSEFQKILFYFSELWESLASDFLNEKFYKEYCNIKHGFRIEHGGFELKIAQADKKTKTPPLEDFYSLGKSKYGSKIYVDEFPNNAPKNNNYFSLRKTFFN